LCADPVLKSSICITLFPEEYSFIGPLGLRVLGEFPVDWHAMGTRHCSAQAQGPPRKIGVDIHTD